MHFAIIPQYSWVPNDRNAEFWSLISVSLPTLPQRSGSDASVVRHHPIVGVVCLDCSGSMDKDGKLLFTKACFRSLLSLFGPDDAIGLVSFADTATVEVPPIPMNDLGKARYSAAIDRLVAFGKTNLSEALACCLDLISTHISANPGEAAFLPAVIVLTDGEPTAGACDLYSMAERMRVARDAYTERLAAAYRRSGTRVVGLQFFECLADQLQ